jgi:hypothetical protein
MADSPKARPIQEAAPRATEGKSSVQTKVKSKGTHQERKRGRPKGSKNKPKALIPREVANDLLGVVKQTLPPELYQEMKDAVRSGKNISTINEARILMKLMGPPVWQRHIEEVHPKAPIATDIDPDLQDEIGGMPGEQPAGFDKDLNERLKVLINLMQFVAKLEQSDDQSDSSTKPILEIIARRGLDGGRIGILIGDQSGVVGRDSDGVGRPEGGVGAVSGELSERQIDVSDSEQVQTDRVLDADSVGDNSRSSDEA